MKFIAMLSVDGKLTENKVYFGGVVLGNILTAIIVVYDDNGAWNTFPASYFRPVSWD